MSAPKYVGSIVQSVEPSSDYDFDLENGEDELLADALDRVQRAHTVPGEDLSDEYETHRILEQSVSPPPAARQSVNSAAVQITYADIFDDTFTVPRDESPGKIEFAKAVDDQKAKTEDTRSPLERFRTAPKKPLSVTDFVSPAWCELQYWYSLNKFGRKKRTPAMKRGSSVHKTLEEEVHVTVPIDVQTREDNWGLRIWNIIQGLRTLRVTGMTRELELWGVVDGEVVNGIIDELSYNCPDPELEAQLSGQPREKKQHDIQISPYQATISEFFKSQSSQESASKSAKKDDRKIYLVDVKTRNSKFPPKGASLRPTHMQLMLYRKLLANLANNEVDADVVFKRYDLDPSRELSVELIQQLAGLEDNLDGEAEDNEQVELEPAGETAVELLQHNTLDKLWQLMMQEFQSTMSQGGDSISKILNVEFRTSSDGKIMSALTFQHNDSEIDAYIADEMKWWRGQRPAQGVELEEAFKCQMCDFAENCEWRINKIGEAVNKHRMKPQQQPSGVPNEVA